MLSLPHLVSFHTLNGRRVLPQIMLTTKYLLEWLRAVLVAVGQGRDHSPDTKRTAEPLHHQRNKSRRRDNSKFGIWVPKLKRTTMALRWEVSNFLRRIVLRLGNPIGNDALARRGHKGSWWLQRRLRDRR